MVNLKKIEIMVYDKRCQISKLPVMLIKTTLEIFTHEILSKISNS